MEKNLSPQSKPGLSSFNWDYPFRLDTQLTEEERMSRDASNAYTQEKLQPRVIEAYRNESTDPDIFREMGLLGVTFPEAYDGMEAGYVAYGLVAKEM